MTARRAGLDIACTMVALLALHAAAARADDEPPPPPDDAVMVKIRALYANKDLVGVRRELLAAYESTRHPALLFALGQVEFNLKNWAAAIDWYEKFVATDPPDDQIALAQQGIGAARIEMQRERDRPAPPPPAEPRRRAWFLTDSVIVAAGGAAVAAGVAAFFYGRHLGNDRGGTLAAYDARTDRARTYQWAGGGLVAAGLVAAGVAVVRWRLRPNDEVVVTASATGAALSVTW